MPSDWRSTTLGDVATETGGSIKTGPFGTALKAAEYADDGVPVISTGEIRYGYIQLQSRTPRVNDETTARLSDYLLMEGDLVFTRKGAIIDRSARVNAEQHGWFLGSDGLRARVGAGVDTRFLAYQCQSAESRDWIKQHAGGTTMPSLNQAIVGRLPVNLPSLPEQQRIAAVLGALDDLVEANRLSIGRVRDLSRLLYQQVAASSETDQALGEVATVSDAKTKPSSGRIRYIDIASMGDGSLEVPEAIDWNVAPSRARIKASRGSTLWSTVRPNRRAHALLVEAPDDLVVSTGIAVLTPRSIGPAELFAATDQEQFVEQLVSLADGSAYPAVRPGAFREVRIARLDPEASARFEGTLWSLWLDAQACADEMAGLTRARNELLPLLMSGRVRVSEDLVVA